MCGAPNVSNHRGPAPTLARGNSVACLSNYAWKVALSPTAVLSVYETLRAKAPEIWRSCTSGWQRGPAPLVTSGLHAGAAATVVCLRKTNWAYDNLQRAGAARVCLQQLQRQHRRSILQTSLASCGLVLPEHFCSAVAFLIYQPSMIKLGRTYSRLEIWPQMLDLRQQGGASGRSKQVAQRGGGAAASRAPAGRVRTVPRSRASTNYLNFHKRPRNREPVA